MKKPQFETLLRSAFLFISVLLLGLTTLNSSLIQQKQPSPVLGPRALDAAICAAHPPPKPGKMGILTYVKLNWKRWKREIKSNPVKWIKMKEKLKKFLKGPKEGKKQT